jgi:hypothetical protein
LRGLHIFPSRPLNVYLRRELVDICWYKMSKITVFWFVTPCSLVKVCGCFGGTYCLHIQDRRVRKGFTCCLLRDGCLIYSSNLKMEAVYSSETSANFYQSPNSTLHSHCCENLNSDILKSCLKNKLCVTRCLISL